MRKNKTRINKNKQELIKKRINYKIYNGYETQFKKRKFAKYRIQPKVRNIQNHTENIKTTQYRLNLILTTRNVFKQILISINIRISTNSPVSRNLNGKLI